MLNKKKIKIGCVEVNFPDETISCFYIAQDFVPLINSETNYEALKIIKKRLKEILDLKVYKRIDFDSESDEVNISVRKPNLILEISKEINFLCNHMLNPEDLTYAEKMLTSYKKPKKQKWSNGSIFKIPLKDNSFMPGQVLYKSGSYSAICVLFLRKSFNYNNLKSDVNSSDFIILSILSNNLDNHVYKVIDKSEPFFELNSDVISALDYSTHYSSILIELAEGLAGLSILEQHHKEIIAYQKVLLNNNISL